MAYDRNMNQEVEVLPGTVVLRANISMVSKSGLERCPETWSLRKRLVCWITGNYGNIGVDIYLLGGGKFSLAWQLSGDTKDNARKFADREAAYRRAVAAWVGPFNMGLFDQDTNDIEHADKAFQVGIDMLKEEEKKPKASGKPKAPKNRVVKD